MMRSPGRSRSGSVASPEVPSALHELETLRALRPIYDQMIPVAPVLGETWPPPPSTLDCSALFTDLRGFTRLTEELADRPSDLLAVLNEHLVAVVRAIVRCGGVIEKFVGDGVFATFGAHAPLVDHRERALAAALASVGSNEVLNRRMAPVWGFRVEVGIGVAAGKVVVGRIGTEARAEIAVLGDAVNVAARLVAQAAPGEILLAASVFRPIAGSIRADLVGIKPIRGRVHGVEIYRLNLLPSDRP